MRNACGEEVELLHDIHERLHPIDAIGLCKDVEKYRPFFMEDPFSPEDVGYFKVLRPQTSTPLAMGELFNNPNEWVDLVSGRLVIEDRGVAIGPVSWGPRIGIRVGVEKRWRCWIAGHPAVSGRRDRTDDKVDADHRRT